MKLSLKEIKKAADEELKRQDYKLSMMIFVGTSAVDDENNTDKLNSWLDSWKEYVENTPEHRIKVEGHDYVVVMYQRKIKRGQMIKGGEAYIFVDRNTGEILLFLRGK